MKASKVVTIRHRETREVSMELDVTGWSAHNFEKMWDGLVWKVNFEEWEPVFTPGRGEDETTAEWLRA